MDLPTTIIFKVTNSCNAKCTYCYEDNSPVAATALIPLHVIEKALAWAHRSGLAKVQFVWHGGEPLLAGRSFFQDVLAMQDKYARSTLEILHSIQTNGSLVDDSWISFFKTAGFGVGLSLDGPSWLHDAQRPLLSGKSSHTRAISALNKMTNGGLSVSISCVVTKRSIGIAGDLMRYMSNLPANSVDFLPMTVLADRLQGHDDLIAPNEFSDFMEAAFREWMSLPEDRIMVRYFENVIRGVCGANPTLCTFSGRCGAYISIDYDGSVYPCDSFMRTSTMKIGSLLDSTLDEVLAEPSYGELQKNLACMPDRCVSCPFTRACNGGCPAERYFRGGSFSSDYPFCEVRQRLAMKLLEYLSSYGADGLIWQSKQQRDA